MRFGGLFLGGVYYRNFKVSLLRNNNCLFSGLVKTFQGLVQFFEGSKCAQISIKFST